MSQCGHSTTKFSPLVIKGVRQASKDGCFAIVVQCHCADCGTQFRFMGLPRATSARIDDFTNPLISLDGLSVLIPMEPNEIMTTTEPMGAIAGIGRA